MKTRVVFELKNNMVIDDIYVIQNGKKYPAKNMYFITNLNDKIIFAGTRTDAMKFIINFYKKFSAEIKIYEFSKYDIMRDISLEHFTFDGRDFEQYEENIYYHQLDETFCIFIKLQNNLFLWLPHFFMGDVGKAVKEIKNIYNL